MKKILDACCGARKCWADKKNPNAVFMDIRKETCELSDGRTIEINPVIKAVDQQELLGMLRGPIICISKKDIIDNEGILKPLWQGTYDD